MVHRGPLVLVQRCEIRSCLEKHFEARKIIRLSSVMKWCISVAVFHRNICLGFQEVIEEARVCVLCRVMQNRLPSLILGIQIRAGINECHSIIPSAARNSHVQGGLHVKSPCINCSASTNRFRPKSALDRMSKGLNPCRSPTSISAPASRRYKMSAGFRIEATT
jgi:hypothetical protein